MTEVNAMNRSGRVPATRRVGLAYAVAHPTPLNSATNAFTDVTVLWREPCGGQADIDRLTAREGCGDPRG